MTKSTGGRKNIGELGAGNPIPLGFVVDGRKTGTIANVDGTQVAEVTTVDGKTI